MASHGGWSWFRRCGALAACLLLAGAVTAQEPPVPPARDPAALAARFLGAPAQSVPDLPDVRSLGDTTTFWTPRAGHETPVAVTAELISRAPGVFVWADRELEADTQAAGGLAATLGQIFSVLGLRENYYAPLVLSGGSAANVPTDLVPAPDVDNDAAVHVLFTRDLAEDREAIVRTVDSLPAPFVAGAWANAREVIFVNTSSFPSAPLTDPLYLTLIVSAYQDLLANASNPGQAPWLREALAQAISTGLQGGGVTPEQIAAYFASPDVPLLTRPALTNRSAVTGGQQLLLTYLAQRIGPAFVRDLWPMPGMGIAPIDAALAERNFTDLVSGAPLTFPAVFADFVLANALNAAFGDGRYIHTVALVGADQTPAVTALSRGVVLHETVFPYGVDYAYYAAAAPETVTVRFAGDATTPLLRLPAEEDADNLIYWSGRAANANPTLTRALDLTTVERAELTFRAAYDLSAGWDFGYVSISADGGATWTPLAPSTASGQNRHGLAYGPGWTGISNPELPRPFPILGVVIGADNVTAVELTPDGPAAAAGMQAGDRIIGHHGKPWDGAPNVIGLLAGYAPGDTLPLLIQRDNAEVELDVVLGEHPTRRIEPDPLWLAQRIDLTAYAGRPVVLRFETVTQPGRESGGLAIDDLAVAALGWADDGSGDGWTLDGWVRTANAAPVAWSVQAVTAGSQNRAPRVHPLVDPQDSAPEGDWTFTLAPGEIMLLAVAAISDETPLPAAYRLSVRPAAVSR